MSLMMKKLLIFLLTLTACSDLLWAQATDDNSQIAIHTKCVSHIDTLSRTETPCIANIRPITSTLELHLGSASVRNTYLAPLLYTGKDLGLHYERARRWKNLGIMSLQSLSGQFTTGDDRGSHSENWSGRLRYRYAAMLNCDLFFLTLMAGPYVGGDLGFDYNLKMAGGNNPATARIALNTGASLMGAFHYRIFDRRTKFTLQFQAPLLGYAFMPEYGASYYETFYLDKTQNQHHLTSLHNQQDLDLRLTAEAPLWPNRGGALRLGLGYHIETMDINHTVTRFSAIEAIVGWTLQSIPYNPRKSNLKHLMTYEAY